MSDAGKIIIVSGAQYGSEGKGLVAAALARREGAWGAVRTGAVNAGHTVIYKGTVVKMQQLPVAWVVPGVQLFLGAGAMVNPQVLRDEIGLIRDLTGEDVRERLLIDFRAGVHLPHHEDEGKQSSRSFSIGATGKGCSVAVVDKIKNRGSGYFLFEEYYYKNRGCLGGGDLKLGDVSVALNDAYDQGRTILLEGTQGILLDLHLGPYPYTTHRQTQPANWMAECGLSPSLNTEVVSVARTFPIRVAGNSGPLLGELDWVIVTEHINRTLARKNLPPRVQPSSLEEYWVKLKELEGQYRRKEVREKLLYTDAFLALPEAVRADLSRVFEFTTVTKKLRRVARLNNDILEYSTMLNRPAYVVLNFFNYWFPELWDATTIDWTPEYRAAIDSIGPQHGHGHGVAVKFVGVGPREENLIAVP